ncbi:agglutination protein [Photobacterium aphoticum]|nr:agglutination protein [Photobacterium aphoticum]
MVKMRYNLFNGNGDVAKSREAAYQLNKSKDIRDRAYQMLEQSTRLSWSAMELANQQNQFLEQHVDASARTVMAYEKQFKIGQRTLLDVLNTENELFEARKSYLQAHYNGILAKYRVLNATGQLLAEMRIDLADNWTQSVK